MAETIRFSVPIPKEYRIYYGQQSLAGIGYRKRAVQKAIGGWDQEYLLIPEPGNKHDSNAIMVICKSRNFFGLTRKHHIGYVPKDVAADISDRGITDVLFRPRSLWVGDRDGLELTFDLLGPKDMFKRYFK